jgi:hypothetical protein
MQLDERIETDKIGTTPLDRLAQHLFEFANLPCAAFDFSEFCGIGSGRRNRPCRDAVSG